MVTNQYDAIIIGGGQSRTMDNGRLTMVHGQWSKVSWSQPYVK